MLVSEDVLLDAIEKNKSFNVVDFDLDDKDALCADAIARCSDELIESMSDFFSDGLLVPLFFKCSSDEIIESLKNQVYICVERAIQRQLDAMETGAEMYKFYKIEDDI